jgi:outer membrane biosynthesis protein TonB
MKTKRFFQTAIMIAALIGISGLSALAGKPAMTPALNIQKVIHESIFFPESAAKSGYNGSVDITFTVSNEGRIIVVESIADNSDVEKLVKEQLKLVDYKGVKLPDNQLFGIRITFKLSD